MGENKEEHSSNIFTFKDERPVPDKLLNYTQDFSDSKVPIIIDNGR